MKRLIGPLTTPHAKVLLVVGDDIKARYIVRNLELDQQSWRRTYWSGVTLQVVSLQSDYRGILGGVEVTHIFYDDDAKYDLFAGAFLQGRIRSTKYKGEFVFQPFSVDEVR